MYIRSFTRVVSLHRPVSIITGNDPGLLSATGISGGNGVYSYQWQYTTGDPNNDAGYQNLPGNLPRPMIRELCL